MARGPPLRLVYTVKAHEHVSSLLPCRHATHQARDENLGPRAEQIDIDVQVGA